MKQFCILFFLSCLLVSCSFQPRASWVTTTEITLWQRQPDLLSASADTVPNVDVTVLTEKPLQRIEGFGACFDELGWIALSRLEPNNRERIMEELFFPGYGASFSLCLMPIGANDFARDWYSYDETDGDFEMKNFTIANDHQTLLPFIRNARKYNSDLCIWASPWSSPSWMKENKDYTAGLFVGDSLHMQAYALYFSKFIQAYKELQVDIFAVIPQQYTAGKDSLLPACDWEEGSLTDFAENYLAPLMEEQDVKVLSEGRRYIGNGDNSFSLWYQMRNNLDSGVPVFLYRNIALEKEGVSRWGQKRNALVEVDPKKGSYFFTFDYYILKHLSHHVQPGARKLTTEGAWDDLLAFLNPDGSIVVTLANEKGENSKVSIRVEGHVYQPVLPAHSITTLLID